ncbi:AI-2E family transporter [Mucilaginibacter sp. BJC16-A38]|uniref:AI-2E family transporter n=1 Tax=Mucilaginibacter phenanthrenivorans TaxID=1234842 RepID=UPI0021579E1B|nr:AI-2E family transporter [Mucilaginibacter phenanthrenivorans]MCR8561436.1 AI-2E family transporter [Mucilaginibacter phenanthrenivorans]
MPTKTPAHPFYERLSLVLIGLLSLGYIIIAGKEILDPLIFGFLFAILLLPIAIFLEKKLRLPRAIACLVSILLLLGFISGILYLVGSQISNLASDWPQLQSQVSQSIIEIKEWVQHAFHINAEKQMSYVHSTTQKIIAEGSNVIGTTFGAISSLMLFYIFILIFTFFILLYRQILINFIVWVFSSEYESIVHDIVENIQSILRQYILGLLLEMFVVACLACTAFWFIGAKYAVLLGIIVALFNLIPYLGIFTALLLSTLITFATGTVTSAAWVAGSVLAIHAIDSNFLLPTIVGSKVKLNALITFLGIILGEMIWGLSGMFLSIPIMAIFKIIFDRVESLKPWGYLMGGGNEEKKSTMKKMKPAAADKA